MADTPEELVERAMQLVVRAERSRMHEHGPDCIEFARTLLAASFWDELTRLRGEAKALREALEKAHAKLFDLSNKVEHAGNAGHFENYRPAVRGANKCLKQIKMLLQGKSE